MKRFKIVLVVLLAMFLLGQGEAFAARGDREELNFGYVDVVSTASDAALVARPAYIYGVTLYHDPTSTGVGQVLIYDLSSAATGTTGEVIKVEVVETIQYETKRVSFDPPLRMGTGIYVDVQNASVVVEYR